MTAAELLRLQDEAEQVRADEAVLDYLLAIVSATRSSPLLALGASPRASLALLRVARARALARGRDYLVPDDIKDMAGPALAHRIIVKGYEGTAGGAAEAVVQAIVQDVAVPR